MKVDVRWVFRGWTSWIAKALNYCKLLDVSIYVTMLGEQEFIGSLPVRVDVPILTHKDMVVTRAGEFMDALSLFNQAGEKEPEDDPGAQDRLDDAETALSEALTLLTQARKRDAKDSRSSEGDRREGESN